MTIRTKPVDYIVFWICFCQFDDSLNSYGSVYARVTVPKMGRWAWEGRGFCLYYIHCFFCFCAGILLFMKWYQCWKLWGSWHFNWTPSYKRKHWWEQWRWWRRGYYFQPKQTSAVGSCFCHYPETGWKNVLRRNGGICWYIREYQCFLFRVFLLPQGQCKMHLKIQNPWSKHLFLLHPREKKESSTAFSN